MIIINANLVMVDHIIPNAYLKIEDGFIKDYGKMRNLRDLAGHDSYGHLSWMYLNLLPETLRKLWALKIGEKSEEV